MDNDDLIQRLRNHIRELEEERSLPERVNAELLADIKTAAERLGVPSPLPPMMLLKEEREALASSLRASFGEIHGDIEFTFNDLTRICGQWFSDVQGFLQENFAVDCMLVVTEVAEACEADRAAQKADDANLPSEHCPDISGREEEIADILVRCFHAAYKYRLRIGQAFISKMLFNFTRPIKHGKAY